MNAVVRKNKEQFAEGGPDSRTHVRDQKLTFTEHIGGRAKEAAHVNSTLGELGRALEEHGLRPSNALVVSGGNPHGRDIGCLGYGLNKGVVFSFNPRGAVGDGSFMLHHDPDTRTVTLVVASGTPSRAEMRAATELAAVKAGVEVLADEQKGKKKQPVAELADRIMEDIATHTAESQLKPTDIDLAAIKLTTDEDGKGAQLDLSRRGKQSMHILVIDPNDPESPLRTSSLIHLPSTEEIGQLYDQLDLKASEPDLIQRIIAERGQTETQRVSLEHSAEHRYSRGVSDQLKARAIARHYAKQLPTAQRAQFEKFVRNALPDYDAQDPYVSSIPKKLIIDTIKTALEIATFSNNRLQVEMNQLVLIANDSFFEQFQGENRYVEAGQALVQQLGRTENLEKAVHELLPEKIRSNVILSVLQPAPVNTINLKPEELL